MEHNDRSRVWHSVASAAYEGLSNLTTETYAADCFKAIAAVAISRSFSMAETVLPASSYLVWSCCSVSRDY